LQILECLPARAAMVYGKSFRVLLVQNKTPELEYPIIVFLNAAIERLVNNAPIFKRMRELA
jgi:hypothetical protein